MSNRLLSRLVIAGVSIIALACQPDRVTVEPSLGSAPGSRLASREVTPEGPQAVVVNPNGYGNGVAATIQEAIDRVGSGGQVPSYRPFAPAPIATTSAIQCD